MVVGAASKAVPGSDRPAVGNRDRWERPCPVVWNPYAPEQRSLMARCTAACLAIVVAPA